MISSCTRDMSRTLKKRCKARQDLAKSQTLKEYMCPACKRVYQATKPGMCVRCKISAILKRLNWSEKICLRCHRSFFGNHQQEICNLCLQGIVIEEKDATSTKTLSGVRRLSRSGRESDKLSRNLCSAKRNSPFVHPRKNPGATFICRACRRSVERVTNLDLVHGGLCASCYNKLAGNGGSGDARRR